MKLALKFARRYLISKKSTNAINIISGVAVLGMVVTTMAFILILSVINGFEDLVISLFNTFNPDLKAQVKEGKTFALTPAQLNEIAAVKGVEAVAQVLEENAVIMYNDKSLIVTLKGVDEVFSQVSSVDTSMVDGEFYLQTNEQAFAVIGAGVASMLGINLFNQFAPLQVYLPKRTGKLKTEIDKSFNDALIQPAGVFSIQADFDSRFVITPINFVRKLLEYEKEVSALEIAIQANANQSKVQQQIQSILGKDFKVLNRYQQDEYLYKIMRMESWAAYAILSFILLVTAFNIVGSLAMLVMEKRNDISILKAMGATDRLIYRIFLIEGMLLAIVGAVIGMTTALIICLLQQRYKLIKIEGDSFLIDAYPVSLRLSDFVFVAITVLIIALLASYYPAKKATDQSAIVPDVA